MHVEHWPINRITPYDSNPRHNDNAVDAVAASIREFGWHAPIVVDAEGVIVCGHTRYRAAIKLGLETVPVHVAKDLSPDQIRAYRIADNQTASLSEWDYDLLPIEIAGLKDANYDLGLLSFDPDELARLLSPGGVEGLCDPDEVPEAPAEAITQRGDVWVLGQHRLICGDSTDAAVVASVLDGSTADLLLTDPPNNVAYEGKTSDRLVISNDEMNEDAYRQFLAAAFTAAVEHLAPGGSYYFWHADTHGLTVRNACADAGLDVRQCLVWVKQTMVLGRQDYHWRHEPCLYGWKDGASHTWLGGRAQTTVLAFDKPSRSAEHPTMKPVELFATLIANSCPHGGNVLDLFGGSGSTLIAAEQSGRRAFLVELDPLYCDVIVRRYETFTGKKAERIGAEAIA